MAVAVKSKQHEEFADLEGLSVSEVREKYQEKWNIAPEAIALVEGREVSEEYVLRDGDRIEFCNSEPMW